MVSRAVGTGRFIQRCKCINPRQGEEIDTLNEMRFRRACARARALPNSIYTTAVTGALQCVHPAAINALPYFPHDKPRARYGKPTVHTDCGSWNSLPPPPATLDLDFCSVTRCVRCFCRRCYLSLWHTRNSVYTSRILCGYILPGCYKKIARWFFNDFFFSLNRKHLRIVFYSGVWQISIFSIIFIEVWIYNCVD